MPASTPSDEPTPLSAGLRAELSQLTTSVCRALNDTKRLLLLYALADGSRTVSELCDLIDAPQANTSQHLAVLRERGLVEADRQGNNVYYSLRHQRVLEAVDILREIMADEVSRRSDLLA